MFLHIMRTQIPSHLLALMHINVYAYVTYIHTYIHACMHACMHTDRQTCMHTYIHTYIHTCIHVCPYMHIYVFPQHDAYSKGQNRMDMIGSRFTIAVPHEICGVYALLEDELWGFLMRLCWGKFEKLPTLNPKSPCRPQPPPSSCAIS